MNGRLKVAGALALVLALGAVGCGDNGGSLAGFRPEGLGDAALLLADVQPVTPADSSQVVVFGVIYDHTTANGYRLYVDPNGTGYRPAADFVSAPTKTYSTGFNEYTIRANQFVTEESNFYLGRGARNGYESGDAPLTEIAAVSGTPFPVLLARRLDVPLLSPADSAATDSIPVLSWDAVSGAVEYRVTITGRNGINYLVLVPGTTHQVEIDPATVLEDIPLRPGLLYRWQVEALDVWHRLFAKTKVTRAILVN
jgi:hypothetical protein